MTLVQKKTFLINWCDAFNIIILTQIFVYLAENLFLLGCHFAVIITICVYWVIILYELYAEDVYSFSFHSPVYPPTYLLFMYMPDAYIIRNLVESPKKKNKIFYERSVKWELFASFNDLMVYFFSLVYLTLCWQKEEMKYYL